MASTIAHVVVALFVLLIAMAGPVGKERPR